VNGRELRLTYLMPGKWATIFIVIAAVISLPVHMIGVVTLGWSANSDVVFAIDAFLGGIAAELILRVLMNRKLVLSEAVKVPVVYLWLALCGYVMFAKPFEHP
jgi:hypothetical protein